MAQQSLASPGKPWWTPASRCVVFLLAASSIACLLLDFYGVCSMRLFTMLFFLPAMLVLLVIAWTDRLRGKGDLWQAVVIGLIGGLLAAIAYDLFRLPFVFAREWGLASIIHPMPLFKVFPRFGAMILGQPVEQSSYGLLTQLVGWAYHFSNGATFGVMYMALIGSATRRHWAWGIVMALCLELGMLLTPYPGYFGIPITVRFICVTVAAHSIFGAGLGLSVRGMSNYFKNLSMDPSCRSGTG